jgi:glycosyltransferase involved in cell wall biosynthesis
MAMFEQKTPRILRIITRMNIGGPAQQVAALNHLEGFETLNLYGHCADDETEDQTSLATIRDFCVFIPDLGRSIHPLRDLRAFWEIRRQIKRWKPDIVHTHTAKAGILGRLAAWKCGVPVILHTYHGHTFKHYFNPVVHKLFLQIERLLAGISTRLITISASQQVEINSIYCVGSESSTVVIPLGLNLDRFYQIVNDAGIVELKPRIQQITWCGRLVPVKNPLLALDIARLLKQDISLPDWKMVIAGDGNMRQALEARIASDALAEVVELVSWQKDMQSIWAGSAIALQTSLNEGTPVSLIEAMASGVPVVSTQVGGIEEICGNAALLAPSGDAEGLAQHIKRILLDDYLKVNMASEGRLRSKGFTKERLRLDIKVLYQSLLKSTV